MRIRHPISTLPAPTRTLALEHGLGMRFPTAHNGYYVKLEVTDFCGSWLRALAALGLLRIHANSLESCKALWHNELDPHPGVKRQNPPSRVPIESKRGNQIVTNNLYAET